ncbi:MAG: FimV/HubP family polar landmark protein [Rhodanobacter lindaniclasticus]
MNRSLKLSMLVALALGSSQLLALDLGQVQVKSALGQPLLAEIPLHPANPAELQGLTVKLASSEQFARAGIVGGRTDIPLHFSVAAGAHPVIRITSSVPVNDPYLDLLIEVDGKDGPSVREYAILLDPPGTHSAVAAVAAPAPAVSPRQASPTPRPAQSAPAKASQPAPVTRAPTPAAVQNGRFPVQSGQTLSGIARSVAPAGVDVRQMMLALQQANPDAFYRDNINALKSGVVLRVPTASEAQAMTLAAAAAEVSRQNSDWRAGTPGSPAVVADAATRASSSGSPTTGTAGNEDRLALVPPQAGGVAAGGQSAGKADQSAASLRDELLRSREGLASLKQQSDDLKARLKDLNDINTKNEHLLSLKDSEIAELQAKLAAARKASGAPATAPAAAGTAAAEPLALEPAVATAGSSAEASESPLASAASASGVASAASVAGMAPASAGSASLAMAGTAAVVTPAPAAASTAATEPAATPVPASAPARVVEQPWYMQTWAWAAAAGAVIVLILLAVLGRRRKPAAAAKAGSSLADRFGATPPADDDDLLADGDTDQEQLLDQLAEHPDDIYLHLELVTLYYSRRDVERFEAAAEAMHAHITDPAQDEWQDVVHMGEDLAPEHPLFDHHAQPADVDSEAAQAFDIDDYADDSDAPTVVSSLPASGKKVTGYSFDFDLTQPAAGESRTPPPATADDVTVVKPHAEPKASWDAPETGAPAAESVEFSDDPVDTKLDLARAYLDMGDADGARAMLGEVLKEGSQMQRDVARKLLDGLG